MKAALAAEYAKIWHETQTDDAGRPYFDAHLQPVANIIKLLTDDDDLVAAAYLHDVLEDTPHTFAEIRELFGRRVAELVQAVTWEGTNDDHWYPSLDPLNRDAVLLKFADRLQNLSRMENWSEKRRCKYLRSSVFWRRIP